MFVARQPRQPVSGVQVPDNAPSPPRTRLHDRQSLFTLRIEGLQTMFAQTERGSHLSGSCFLLCHGWVNLATLGVLLCPRTRGPIYPSDIPLGLTFLTGRDMSACGLVSLGHSGYSIASFSGKAATVQFHFCHRAQQAPNTSEDWPRPYDALQRA